ncbi:MAG TPA: TetR/AcrR family transcriptional regulator [Trebonia sp.]|nr:TetR/AcrR family transcriptional regulator [Trebonia sp.]
MTASSPPASESSAGTRSRRRDQILAVAAELFATKGYTRTSMRDVAAASGILAGSLYHHFESKEAIAVELVESYYSDLVAAAQQDAGTDPGVDPLTALRRFTTEIAALSFRHQAALQIRMFEAPSAASPTMKTVVHAAPDSLSRRWQTLVDAAVAAGGVSPDIDPELLCHVLYRVTIQAGQLAGQLGRQRPGGAATVIDCVTAIIFDGLAARPVGDNGDDSDDGDGDDGDDGDSTAIAVVDEAKARWEADAAERLAGRRGAVLAAARDQFARRGFESTTMRDIAEAAGLTASNLYRYFESKDALILEILGDFSDRLLAAYKDVIGAGATVTETLDAILWLLEQASSQFGPEIEILQGFGRLVALGLGEHYEQGAQARLALLAQLIGTGVAAGEFRPVAGPELVATCVREIMWSPMRDLAEVSPLRARKFFRRLVLSGAAARP